MSIKAGLFSVCHCHTMTTTDRDIVFIGLVGDQEKGLATISRRQLAAKVVRLEGLRFVVPNHGVSIIGADQVFGTDQRHLIDVVRMAIEPVGRLFGANLVNQGVGVPSVGDDRIAIGKKRPGSLLRGLRKSG